MICSKIFEYRITIRIQSQLYKNNFSFDNNKIFWVDMYRLKSFRSVIQIKMHKMSHNKSNLHANQISLCAYRNIHVACNYDKNFFKFIYFTRLNI